MALNFASNVANRVDHGSGATLDNITTGTIAFWFNASNVNNDVRNLITKGSGTGGWELFRRGVDGTSLRFLVYTGTGNAVDVVSNTGVINTTDWTFIATTWNTSANTGTIYRASLSSYPSSVTSSATGSGTPASDAAASLYLGNGASLDHAWPGTISWFGVWNDVLTLTELTEQWRRLHSPVKKSNCVLFSHPGLGGSSSAIDWSGNNNHGTVTGATTAVGVPIPIHRYSIWMPYPVSAGTPTLTVQDASVTTQVDAIQLTQVHNIVVPDAFVTTQVDSLSLTQVHNLVVNDGFVTTQVDNVNLTQVHNLSVNDGFVTTQVDSIVLTQLHNLVLNDSFVTTQVDHLNITQVHNLQVGDGFVTTQVDSLSTTITYVINALDSFVSTQVDALSLTQVHNLALSDSYVITQVDSVIISTTNVFIGMIYLTLGNRSVGFTLDDRDTNLTLNNRSSELTLTLEERP